MNAWTFLAFFVGMLLVVAITLNFRSRKKDVDFSTHTDYAKLLHSTGVPVIGEHDVWKRDADRPTVQLNEEERLAFHKILSPAAQTAGLTGEEPILYMGRSKSSLGGNPDPEYEYPIFYAVRNIGGKAMIDITPWSPTSPVAHEIAEKYDALAKKQ